MSHPRFPLVFMDRPWQLSMGLNKLEPGDWIDIDRHYAHELALKQDLLASRREDVLVQDAHAEAAARELLALLIDHLARFHRDRFEAVPQGVRVRSTGREVRRDAPEPLVEAGLLVQEDFVLLAKDASGSYVLEAAFLCFPMRWRLKDKFLQPMRAIHQPVPGYAAKLGNPVDRFFASVTPERPVWRANWSFTDDPTLFQPDTRQKPMALDARTLGASLHLRVEKQTLRRLPASQFVAFGVHSYVCSLDEIAAVPGAPAALAARLREMAEPMLRYKNLLAILPLVLPWLDERAAREAAAGLEGRGGAVEAATMVG